MSDAPKPFTLGELLDMQSNWFGHSKEDARRLIRMAARSIVLEAELACLRLVQLQADALGSQLLDVQQDCIAATKRVAALEQENAALSRRVCEAESGACNGFGCGACKGCCDALRALLAETCGDPDGYPLEVGQRLRAALEGAG